jgi:predicted ribosomally synthesized peptide with nif11-like leader
MKNFIEKLRSDEELLKKAAELKKSENPESFIALMREQGVTEEDIQKGIEFEKSFTTRISDELSDTDLELVAGGKGCKTDIIPDKHNICVIANIDATHGDDNTCACPLVHMYVDRPADDNDTNRSTFL